MTSYTVFIEEITSDDLGDRISCVLQDVSTEQDTHYFDLERDAKDTYVPCEQIDVADPLTEYELMLQENLAAAVNNKIAAGEKLVDRYSEDYVPFQVGI